MPEDIENSKPDEITLIDIKELADRLSVTTRTLRTMIREGSIPYMRVRNSYRFYYPDVKKSLEDATKK